jgi:hypothetical protein
MVIEDLEAGSRVCSTSFRFALRGFGLGFAIGFMSKGFGAQLGFGESVEIRFGKVPDLRRWYYVRDQLRSGSTL